MHIMADKVFIDELNKEFNLDIEYKDFKQFYTDKVKPSRAIKRAKNFNHIDPELEKELMKLIK
jgi:hypothetical protein